MELYITIMSIVRSLIKQPSQTGNKKVIKTFKFKRGGYVKSLLLCAYNLSVKYVGSFYEWNTVQGHQWPILLRRTRGKTDTKQVLLVT